MPEICFLQNREDALMINEQRKHDPCLLQAASYCDACKAHHAMSNPNQAIRRTGSL